jgi:hypothetical protein
MNDTVKFGQWIRELAINSSFLDRIDPPEWELIDFQEFIKRQISKEMQEINNILLLNPEMKYGKDFTSQEYENLKQIKKIVENRLTAIIPQPEKRKQPEYETLFELFASASKYHNVMNLLVDAVVCQKGTYIWKDEKKGSKTLVASLIKHLHKQGYYKDNHTPTTNEIVLIACNTFSVKVSKSTIKHASNELPPGPFKIPPATTLA